MPVTIFKNNNGQYFTENNDSRTYVTPVNTTLGDESQWTYRDEQGNIYNSTQPVANKDEQLSQRLEGESSMDEKYWAKKHPFLNMKSNVGNAIHNTFDFLSDYVPGVGYGMAANNALYGDFDKASEYAQRGSVPTALALTGMNPYTATALNTAILTHAGADAALHGINSDNIKETAQVAIPYYSIPRIKALTGFGQHWLTGKMNDSFKPYAREYLGKAYYDNIRPSGYGNGDPYAPRSRSMQLFRTGIDMLKPDWMKTRTRVEDGDYIPQWFNNRNEPQVYEMFRNDAHRLSMNLPAHQETLPDGTKHSLFIQQPNGTYSLDGDYIRFVKSKYLNNQTPIQKEDFPIVLDYYGDVKSGNIVANDKATTVGGWSNYLFNPSDARPSLPGYHFINGRNVIFRDIWNVQPLLDVRTFHRGITKTATRLENSKIPWISKLGHNIKNLELVGAFGGKPFTQEYLLPNQMLFLRKKTNSTINGTKEYNKDNDQFR